MEPGRQPKTSDLRERITWEAIERDSNPPHPALRRELLDRLMTLLFGRGFTLMNRLRAFLIGRERSDGRDTALHRAWEEFRSQYRHGDEVWRFSNDRFTSLAGRAGYALVRDGEVVASITTLES
jgi:hypothetical protein